MQAEKSASMGTISFTLIPLCCFALLINTVPIYANNSNSIVPSTTVSQHSLPSSKVNLTNVDFYYNFADCSIRNCSVFISHFTNYLQQHSDVKLINSSTFSSAVINELRLCGAAGGQCESNQLSEVDVNNSPYELALEVKQTDVAVLAYAVLTQSKKNILTLQAVERGTATRRTLTKLAERLSNDLMTRISVHE